MPGQDETVAVHTPFRSFNGYHPDFRAASDHFAEETARDRLELKERGQNGDSNSRMRGDAAGRGRLSNRGHPAARIGDTYRNAQRCGIHP